MAVGHGPARRDEANSFGVGSLSFISRMSLTNLDGGSGGAGAGISAPGRVFAIPSRTFAPSVDTTSVRCEDCLKDFDTAARDGVQIGGSATVTERSASAMAGVPTLGVGGGGTCRLRGSTPGSKGNSGAACCRARLLELPHSHCEDPGAAAAYVYLAI